MWIDFDKRRLYLLVIYFKIHVMLSLTAFVPDNRPILMLLFLHILQFVDGDDGPSFGDLID
jgi:hypothetical protein